MDDLKEMDKFLETYNLPRLNHEEIENMNRPDIAIVIEKTKQNKTPKKKSSGPVFTGKFY